MKKAGKTRAIPIAKLRTGLQSFDEISEGGLPKGRLTLFVGEAGAGKTVFAMQTLVHAAVNGDAGVMVAFEENPSRLVANAQSLGWNIRALLDRRLHFIDGRTDGDSLQAGDFSLDGLFAMLEAVIAKSRARLVVLDAIDVLLGMFASEAARARELLRLQSWLDRQNVTCVVTVKKNQPDQLAYLADCVVNLERDVYNAVSLRTLFISKYRGSAHLENRVPYQIGRHGVELSSVHAGLNGYKVFDRRVSSGMRPLDDMLGGGFMRGSTTLLTGAPGTAKTTLAGAFAQAACLRGESTVYVCFDEAPGEIVRNLRSVGLDLAPHVQSGRLRMLGVISRALAADSLLSNVLAQLESFRPRCVIIDPVSALSHGGGHVIASSIADRLIHHCKREGITLFLTSVVSTANAGAESSDLHVSTLADTWIHLSYLVHSGERNRALSIVKSRGAAHSNQVRELQLSAKGISLAEAYTEDGEVLMGTLRWQRERQAEAARHHAVEDAERARRDLEHQSEELEARIRGLQKQLGERRSELQKLGRSQAQSDAKVKRYREKPGAIRGGIAATRPLKSGR